MNSIKKIIVVVVLVTIGAMAAQSPESPPESQLDDKRLPVSTLVREDIFAGFLTNDMDRFARGEKNLDLLLEKRPAAKPDALAWKAGAVLYRAVRAHEAGRKEEFQQKYQQALDLFAKAKESVPQHPVVAAVAGGSYVLFADRLPKEYRAAAWTTAYDSFQILWKQQGAAVDKIPVHLKGELLAGLAQSSQRTGHTEESNQYLDKILELLPGTPYEPVAKQWKKNPASAATGSITCLTCHEDGRLAARVAALNSK